MGKFTVEEINFICVFDTENKTKLIEEIGRILQYIKDSEMEELAGNVLTKFQNMTDEEFKEMDLEAAEE